MTVRQDVNYKSLEFFNNKNKTGVWSFVFIQLIMTLFLNDKFLYKKQENIMEMDI